MVGFRVLAASDTELQVSLAKEHYTNRASELKEFSGLGV